MSRVANPRSAVRPVLLDACVMLNLWATGRFDEIMAANAMQPQMSLRARAEAQWVANDEGGRDEIPIRELVLDSRLIACSAVDDEVAVFLELAVKLGDGEAETLAIASARGIPLLTDDQGAHKAAPGLVPPPTLLRTSDVLRKWSEGESPAVLVDALRRIERNAAFRPGAGDDNRRWWEEARRRG